MSAGFAVGKVAKTALCGFCSRFDGYIDAVGLFIGESVVKAAGSGGGSETFIRSPKIGLFGEVVDGRLNLCGERPLEHSVGGSRTMSLVEAMSFDETLPDEAGRAK